MRRIFNRLNGKSWEDILLRMIKELFAVYARSKKREKVLTSPSFDKKRRVVDFRLINWTYRNSTEDEIISEATKVLEHRFDLLGSGSVKVSYDNMDFEFEGFQYRTQLNRARTFCALDKYEPIDWHCDFKSGFRWDGNLVYSKVRKTSDNLPGVDIKLPWELSRFQHLTVLLKAYELSKDEKYIQEVLYQIGDWIYNNRPFHGVNWTCTMDVAIRLANWSFAMSFIQENFNLDPSFLRIYNRSFRNHVLYIMTNLEWTKRLTSNHYLSDISGLYVSLVMRGRKSVFRVWAKSRLEKEIIKQTYNDGMNFEASTSYHRLALELFSFPALFSHDTFSNNYTELLQKQFHFIFWLLNKDGSIPLIGDNDSGFFLKTEVNNLTRLDYLAYWSNKIFNNSISLSDYIGYKLFEESGVFVFEKWDIKLVLVNMNNGQNNNGGHSHNDSLSFSLYYKEKPIFLDPGVYVYTSLPDMRNLYRSTNSHNTVIVDGNEQNDFNLSSLFTVQNDLIDRNISIVDSVDSVLCRALVSYYVDKKSDIIKHERTFILTSTSIEITDKITSNNSGNLECIGNLHAPSTVFKKSGMERLITENLSVDFKNCSLNISSDIIPFCDSYGNKSHNLTKINYRFHENATMLFLLNV